MLTATESLALQDGAATFGLSLDAATVARFSQLALMLSAGNLALNLTRIAPDEFVTLHFLDSLALAAVLSPEPGNRLIDVGTGAGFPGIPIALAYPNVQVTLLDGTRKRLDFIDSVIAALGLTNARTVQGRAEHIARQSGHRAAYDIVTARAVAKLPQLAAWLLPLVKPGGHALAYKSRDVEGEVGEALPVIFRLGGKIARIVEVPIPATEIVRKMVLIEKLSANEGRERAIPRRRHRP